MATHDLVAVVPAAGHSRRMGQAKQLMDVDGRPMLRCVLDALTAAGVPRGVVVTHSSIQRVLQLSALPGTTVVLNEDATSEMVDSIRMGLRAALKFEPPPAGFVILPGDQPNVQSDDIHLCLDAFRDGRRDIVVAAFGETRGHPLIVSPVAAAEILAASCPDGLRGWVRAAGPRVYEVACGAGVTQDVDTPEDYERFIGE